MTIETLVKYLSKFPVNSEVKVEIASDEDIQYGGRGDINQINYNVNADILILSHRYEYETKE